MSSPAKPWEKAGITTTTTTASTEQPPSLPDRPSSLTSVNNRFAYGNAYNTPYSTPYSGYNSSPYGGYSGYNSSPYGGYSGYNSSPYGGYSGFGGGYGMNRFGMGPYNRMGYGGIPGEQGELPLGAQVEQSTQQAFFVLDQIVQAFTGFSHMCK